MDIRERLRPFATPAIFFAIFAVALLFRATGHRYGLPYLWHPDEPEQINRALSMLKEGRFNPERFNYPTFFIYLQMVGGALGWLRMVGSGPWVPLGAVDTGYEAGFVHTIGSPELWANGRMVTVLLGSLACAVTFLAGKRLFGTAVGVVAGLVLAASPHHVENSRYITVDAPTSAAMAALLLAAAYVLREGERRHYVMAAAALGAVLGFKYNAAVAVAVPIVAWLLSGRAAERFWWGVALLPLGVAFFLCTSPFVVLDLATAVNDIGAEVQHYQVRGHPGADIEKGLPHLAVMTKYLALDAFPFWSILGVVGAVLGLRKERAATIVTLLFPVLFVAYMARTVVWFPRNLVHVEPAIAILVGVGAVGLWRLLADRFPATARPAAYAGAVLLSLPAAWTAKAAVDLAERKDSRVHLVEWLKAEGPAGKGGEGVVLAVPYELRIDADTLEGLKTVPVSLVSETEADWALKGATHVLGAPKMHVNHTNKIELTPDAIEPAKAWFAARKPVKDFGWAEWPIDTLVIDPYVGLYEVAPAPPRVAGAVAFQADGEWDVPTNWEVTPANFFGRWVRFGNGLLVVRHRKGDPTAVVCGPRVPASHQARVFGYWRRAALETVSGVGARVTVRSFDEKDRMVPGPLGIQPIAASKEEGGPWEELDTTVVLPPGTTRARVCVEVDADRAEVWADDLRLVDAF